MQNAVLGRLEISLLVFLAAAWAAFYFAAHQWAAVAHPWAVGDWLISYESGFVRRGSIGTIIFWLNDLTGQSLTSLVFLLHLMLFTITVLLAAYFCLSKQLSFPVLLLLVSPACFLFPALDTFGGGGRKEMLHFALFGLWCVMLSRSQTISWKLVIAFSGLVALATTAHEMFLFLSVFYAAAYFVRSRQLGLELSVPKLGAIPCAALFLSGFIFLYGTGAAADAPQELCREIVNRGLSVNACAGAISYPSDLMLNLQDTWNKILVTFRYIEFGPALLLLSFFPFALYLLSDRVDHGLKAQALWPGLLASLPLFAMALDWGRWIHIILVSSLFLMMLLAPPKPEKSEAGGDGTQTGMRSVALVSIALSYMLFWSIPHCCTPEFSKSGLVRLAEWVD